MRLSFFVFVGLFSDIDFMSPPFYIDGKPKMRMTMTGESASGSAIAAPKEQAAVLHTAFESLRYKDHHPTRLWRERQATYGVHVPCSRREH